jgi:hypothetical protein
MPVSQFNRPCKGFSRMGWRVPHYLQTHTSDMEFPAPPLPPPASMRSFDFAQDDITCF